MAKNIRLLTAGRIFRHPAYIAIAALSSVLLFYFFKYLIAANNHGIFLLLIPIYIVYALVATSGILLAISLFAIAHSVAARRLGAAGGVSGILLPSLGGLIASCGCTFPLLESVLLFFGVNTFEAIGIVSVVNDYQVPILTAMILANLVMIYYYLGRIPMPPVRKSRK